MARLPLVALLFANGISSVGNVVTTVAVPWFVLETTGSPVRAGLIAVATRIAIIPATFVGGALADRFGAKPISVAADLASGLTVGLVPLLYAADMLRLWHLFALMLLGALLDYPGATARLVLLPDLADRGRIRYERANAAADSVDSTAQIAGAPFAGFLIALVGTANVLWFDAASFFISAALVGLLVPGLRARAPSSEPLLRGSLEGLRFIRRDRLISWLMLTSMVSNFVLSPIGAVLIPLYALQEFGDPARFGLILGLMSVGGLLGALAFGAVGPRLPRRATYFAVYSTMSGSLLVLAAVPPFAVVAATMALFSFSIGLVNPLLQTLRQERTPPELRGRVFGTVLSGVLLASPIGLVVGSLIAELAGLGTAFFFAFVAYATITVGAALNPALREMDLRREGPQVVERPVEQVLTQVEEPGP
jgi:MFS family permease